MFTLRSLSSKCAKEPSEENGRDSPLQSNWLPMQSIWQAILSASQISSWSDMAMKSPVALGVYTLFAFVVENVHYCIFVPVLLQYLPCSIRRAVILDDDFMQWVCLRQQGVELFAQILLAIISAENDGNGWFCLHSVSK